MLISNGSIFMPSVLTLIGIPGLESVQCWIGIPLCVMYLVAVIGNSLIIMKIKHKNSLCKSMCIFLAMLGATDIALSMCILPKMLGIFWLHLTEIPFKTCLLQMWLIHSFQDVESGVLLVMALDHYVAICNPLRHAPVYSGQILTHTGVGVTLRVALLVAPWLVLIQCHLKFYQIAVISHNYCEHMAIMKLATSVYWHILKLYGSTR